MKLKNFCNDLKELMKKYDLEKITPLGNQNSYIEYFPDNGTIDIRGFEFKGGNNENECITPRQAFALYMNNIQVEYYAYNTWWELDDYSPLILFKKHMKWRVKNNEK